MYHMLSLNESRKDSELRLQREEICRDWKGRLVEEFKYGYMRRLSVRKANACGISRLTRLSVGE
jgi:hypothetical protein